MNLNQNQISFHMFKYRCAVGAHRHAPLRGVIQISQGILLEFFVHRQLLIQSGTLT